MSARLLGRIAAEPWLMHEPALRTLLEIADRQAVDAANLEAWKGERPPLEERIGAVGGLPLEQFPGARMRATGLRNGVAVLSINGPIFRYSSLFTAFSGAVSLADFAHDLALARGSSSVRAILLAMDTPGGEATGIAEAARQIRAAAIEKPVVAYVDGAASSAGYWLASAAGEIVVSTTALVGCLGVVAVAMDRRELEAKSGIKRLEFVSSQTPNKRPDPATEGGALRFQALVDRLADEFLGDAAALRGVSVEALLAATDGGGLVIGTDAVGEGLADRVGDFEAVLAELAAGRGKLAAAPRFSTRQPKGKRTMPNTQTGAEGAQGAPQAGDAPQGGTGTPPGPAAPPAPAAAAPQAPPASAGDAAAERARCAGILGSFLAGQTVRHSWLATMAVRDGWSAEAFAASLAEARAEAPAAPAAAAPDHQAAAAGFRAALPAAVRQAPAAEPQPAPTGADAMTDEALRARWDGDANLRAEFGGQFGRFAAYEKALAGGRVRILKNKVEGGGAAA